MAARHRRRETRWLITSDGVRIRAEHVPSTGDLALVVVHGFAASMAKPVNRAVVDRLARHAAVIAVDLRGHGASKGTSTLGDLEVHDVVAAVRWARLLGYARVATVGFSMGAAVCVRHAGLCGGVDAVVAISGPAFWGYRGTPVMRRLHFGVEHPVGRVFVRHGMRTTVVPPPWPDPWPPSPAELARAIAPVPFLVVHGDVDPFFPDEHPRALAREAAAGAAERGVPDRTELWLRPFGHAEAAVSSGLLDEIAAWAAAAA